ncbi:MAG: hypothetical protein HUU34_19460 [Saprospiraceae bacterium]|nr:hypothetical protein [Saprospiraceae bacterium]
MRLQNYIVALLCFVHIGVSGQEKDYPNLIFRVDASVGTNNSYANAFAYRYDNKPGFLLTAHSICGCSTFSISKYTINDKGEIDYTKAKIYKDLTISNVDWKKDAVFVESKEIKQDLKIAPFLKDNTYRVQAYDNELLRDISISFDRNTSNKITLLTFLKNSDINNLELPFNDQKILIFSEFGNIKPGWSGAPIIDQKGMVVSMIHGGFTKFGIPAYFGMDLSSLKLNQITRQVFMNECKKKYKASELTYSGSVTQRQKEVEKKFKVLNEKEEFERYYKYLHARIDTTITPEYIIMDINNPDTIVTSFGKTEKLRSPSVEFSGRLKLIDKQKSSSEILIKISIKSIDDELNLYVETGTDTIKLEHSKKDNDGMKFWILENELLKVIDFKKWFKLVFISINAQQISEDKIKITLFEGNAQNGRKSFISYPEARKKDLVLED